MRKKCAQASILASKWKPCNQPVRKNAASMFWRDLDTCRTDTVSSPSGFQITYIGAQNKPGKTPVREILRTVGGALIRPSRHLLRWKKTELILYATRHPCVFSYLLIIESSCGRHESHLDPQLRLGRMRSKCWIPCQPFRSIFTRSLWVPGCKCVRFILMKAPWPTGSSLGVSCLWADLHLKKVPGSSTRSRCALALRLFAHGAYEDVFHWELKCPPIWCSVRRRGTSYGGK